MGNTPLFIHAHSSPLRAAIKLYTSWLAPTMDQDRERDNSETLIRRQVDQSHPLTALSSLARLKGGDIGIAHEELTDSLA
jgi:hypothetical protein